jgi:ADP-ribose pyrophosphatase
MIKNWPTTEEKEVMKGKIFRYRQVKSHNPAGDKAGDFDILDFHDWVNIIALNDRDEVLLVEQFRHGSQSITFELPGGAIDPGEDPLVAAKREFLEETGYEGKRWQKLGEVDPNPAFMSNHCHVYLAKNIKWKQELELDPLEELEVHLVPFKDIPKMVKEGKVAHSLVLSALYLYSLA